MGKREVKIKENNKFERFQTMVKQYEKEEQEKKDKFKFPVCKIPVENANVQNNTTISEYLIVPDIIITTDTANRREYIEDENESKNDETTKDYLRVATPTSNKSNTSFHEETGEVSDAEENRIDAEKNSEDIVITQEDNEKTKNSRTKKDEDEDDMNRLQEKETGEKIRKQEKKTKKKNRKLPAAVENVNLTFMREVVAMYCDYERLERLWDSEITYPSTEAHEEAPVTAPEETPAEAPEE